MKIVKVTLMSATLKKYSPILKNCGLGEQEIKHTVSDMVYYFAREDRIVWALRIKKVEALKKLIERGIVPTRKQTSFLKKHKHYEDESLSMLHITSIRHFISQSVHQFQSVVFGRETYQELINIFEKKEKTYFRNKGLNHRDLPVEGRVICSINEDLCWFDLEARFSQNERLSLNHCGNAAGRSEDTIYSLRERIVKNGKVFWRPHLTFIFNKEKRGLGERKARFNLKPDKKWHIAIVKLLTDRTEIKHLLKSEHFYASENDFVFNDLSEELKETLKYKRPDLMKWHALPEHKDYDKAAKAWIDLTERMNQPQLSKVIIRALYREGEPVNCMPFSSKETSCSLVLEKLLNKDSSALSDCRPSICMNAPEMFFSRLFVEAFFENSKTNAINAFVDIHNAAIEKGSHENDLFFLNSHYPEKNILMKLAC